MRRNPESAATRRAEIVGMLRAMPTKWRRAYNTARRTLADNGGPVLPDVPTPEQAMLILGNTAGRNRDIDQPTGDQPVPQGVRDEAMHGLRLSYKHDYPGWEFFGIARAIQLVLAPGVPMRTRERMKRYLEAHQKDELAPHYGDEERPSKGYMALLNWGGDAGLAWNEDVKRATYSSRTRGEGRVATRRKNPMYYREPGQKNFRPGTPARSARTSSRRRNGVSEPHRPEKDEAVVMDPKRMARVFIENPKVRRNPSRRNPASETYLEGVERREKRKGKTERAVGKAQLAHGGAVLGLAVAKKAAPAAALRFGATVGGRAIPVVGEVLMVVGAGKEAYKVGKRRLKGGGGSWKTDLAKVGAGAVGLEDFVPEAKAEKSQKAGTKAKKNPRSSRQQVYFDMDETLLHSVEGGRAGLPRIKVGPFYYGVSVRPDAANALLEAAKHADVYVLTTADRQYALKALDAAGLLGPGSPIRAVYSTREAEDVPPPAKNWVLLDNDPESAMEKTTVLVGYDAPERVTLVPDYLAQPRAGRTSLLTGLKKALRLLGKG